MTKRAPTEVAGAGTPTELASRLADAGYIAEPGLVRALFLAGRLGRPLLLEGRPGVGKTEAARSLATATGARLVRVQCYEGIDVHQVLYDWHHAKQLLHLQAVGRSAEPMEVEELFTRRFLLRRPLLEALEGGGDVVLLVDEIDRADEAFEAFLLEFLAEAQVTIPELGTVRAERPPTVILTSNRTREVHDALRRRCLYHWIDFPDRERELAIVRLRAPDVPPAFAEQLADAVGLLRAPEIGKPPGVGEVLDWAAALSALGYDELGPEAVQATLGAVLKHPDDQRLALEWLGAA
jgi:MoxR-like ATPase